MIVISNVCFSCSMTISKKIQKIGKNKKRVRIFVQKRARASVRVYERDVEREKESGQF